MRKEGQATEVYRTHDALRQSTIIDSSSTPINDHPRLDPSKIHWKTHPVITQPNFILSELFSSLNQVRLWMISRIWPNNPSSPNDEHRVKSNFYSHIASRKSVEFIPDYDLTVAALKLWDNNKPKIKFGIVDVNSNTIIFNLLVFFKNRFKS